MLNKIGPLDEKHIKILTVVLFSLIILNLTDEFMTFYCFYYSNTRPEEVGLLAGPERSITDGRVIGSTVYSLTLIIFILACGLWRYRIIRSLLYFWLLSEIILFLSNLYWAWVIFSP
ncbi:MAG TPA: hypothetical protein P5524_03085 [Candidatus Paceibacterota bacterium]|nr:hypothetical protein [Candidatus Paceibacterota bacterium]